MLPSLKCSALPCSSPLMPVPHLHCLPPPTGQHFGVHVASPFLHPSVVAAALRLSKSDCVGERGGQRFGKLPLRLACPEVPSCWRAKDPIEVGVLAAGLTV